MKLRRLILLSTVFALTGCSGGGLEPADLDNDGDGYVASLDCNDNSVAVHPDAVEVCDGVDQDCNGEIDEGTGCVDEDGDGSLAAVDCDDTNAATYPGAPEACNGVDNDCDGTVDEGTKCYDDDFDGQTEDEGDCNDANANTYAGAPEVCDGLDNNCTGDADEGIDCSGDGDGDGFTVLQGDCDDTNAAVKPTGVEVCDTFDNNCDGVIDEGTSCYDDDHDGQTEDGGDCNDADRATWTGALEICDDKDNNCDGVADEGIDCSGDGDLDGFTVAQGDCDDTNSTIHPDGVEICDHIDQSCDGVIDEHTPCFDDDGDTFTENDGDCDDAAPAVNPAADEVEDGVDNDCDGLIDENVAVCDNNELEPNNSFFIADPLSMNGQTCGAIDLTDDVDTFSITLDAWTYLTLDIDADVLGSSLDSELYLYDSAETQIAFSDDSDITQSVDSQINILLPNAGTYYAKVQDHFGTNSVDHTYSLWAFTASMCDREEVEPNPDSVLADNFVPGANLCGVVDDWRDEDWFKFTVAADTYVTFSVDALSMDTGLQAQLRLYDTDGQTQLVNATSTSTSDPYLTWHFADAGTYYIEVESQLVLTRDSGAYLLWTW